MVDNSKTGLFLNKQNTNMNELLQCNTEQIDQFLIEEHTLLDIPFY